MKSILYPLFCFQFLFLWSMSLNAQAPKVLVVDTHEWPHVDFTPIASLEDARGRAYLVGEMLDPATRFSDSIPLETRS